MTLQQAHEIQRKELLSLRAENKRLKSGTFTNDEKISLEKEIRNLRATIKELTKSIERYPNWLSIEKRKCESLEDIIYGDYEDFKRDHLFLQQEYDKVILQLSSVTNSNEKLKAQLNRDHENSSIPSSKERFPKKIKNSRVKTDRKQGAQTGHPGYRRPHMTPTKPSTTLNIYSYFFANKGKEAAKVMEEALLRKI